MPGRRLNPTLALIGVIVMAGVLLAAGRPYKPPMLRVKVAELSTPVRVGGGRARAGGRNHRFSGEVSLQSRGKGVSLGGKDLPLPVSIGGDPVTVNGKPYRGELMVIAGSPPLVINLVDAESYLAGVVNHEIDSRWPEAAVEAQVVLARTYAILRKLERADKPYDLDSSVKDQVYGGMSGEDERAWQAVNRTRGLVMTWQGKPAQALYHSCCGGRTELPSQVWGGQDLLYQRSIECPYCGDAPRYFWRFPERGSIGGRDLAALLGIAGEVVSASISEKTATGRARMIELVTADGVHAFTGQEFRRRVGYDKIFSTAFQPELEDGGFVFRGSGSGHGVGLCQWGARAMAEQGLSRDGILRYYFPDTTILQWD